MEEKKFKKQVDFDNFIKELQEDTFYKVLSIEKTLFRTITEVLIFNNKDVEEYLTIYFNKILEIFDVKNFQSKIYLDNNKFYIKINTEEKTSILLKEYGFVISAIQNLLVSYIFTKFSKWYKVSININNHLHNQKYFFKKQIYFAINNIQKTNKSFHLKPMPNDQRRVIHNLVREIDGFSSFSEGNGFLRHIVIKANK